MSNKILAMTLESLDFKADYFTEKALALSLIKQGYPEITPVYPGLATNSLKLVSSIADLVLVKKLEHKFLFTDNDYYEAILSYVSDTRQFSVTFLNYLFEKLEILNNHFPLNKNNNELMAMACYNATSCEIIDYLHNKNLRFEGGVWANILQKPQSLFHVWGLMQKEPLDNSHFNGSLKHFIFTELGKGFPVLPNYSMAPSAQYLLEYSYFHWGEKAQEEEKFVNYIILANFAHQYQNASVLSLCEKFLYTHPLFFHDKIQALKKHYDFSYPFMEISIFNEYLEKNLMLSNKITKTDKI